MANYLPLSSNMRESDIAGDIELHIHEDDQESNIQLKDEAFKKKPTFSSLLKQWKWWLLVILNIAFILGGQTIATLLGRLYYNEGGNSKWMATLVQSIGFPVLFIPQFFYIYSTPFSTSTSHVSVTTIAIIYTLLGLLITCDNLMYSYGLLYLPVSTYSLVCATQLAFNAVFSYFLNAQKFTPLIFNSVVLLTFSAVLLGVQSDSDDSSDVSKDKYPLGFVLTLGASATYSLLLSLMQLAFEKVIKTETFLVVLEMQIWTSFVASCATIVGLFASGEWRSLNGEMESYGKGKASYVMTLVWIAISWQVSAVGVIGLVFMVSSLFSNVISTLVSPIVPVFAVIFFGDKMNGVKIMAMLIAVWGFFTYIYQHYLDEKKAKMSAKRTDEEIDFVSGDPCLK